MSELNRNDLFNILMILEYLNTFNSIGMSGEIELNVLIEKVQKEIDIIDFKNIIGEGLKMSDKRNEYMQKYRNKQTAYFKNLEVENEKLNNELIKLKAENKVLREMLKTNKNGE